jgi:hypothetical protein
MSVSALTIQLQLYTPDDTGGSEIISYELWIDQGAINTLFTKVTTYAGSTLTHTLGKVSDSLTLGKIYSIKFRAQNQVGYS